MWKEQSDVDLSEAEKRTLMKREEDSASGMVVGLSGR